LEVTFHSSAGTPRFLPLYVYGIDGHRFQMWWGGGLNLVFVNLYPCAYLFCSRRFVLLKIVHDDTQKNYSNFVSFVLIAFQKVKFVSQNLFTVPSPSPILQIINMWHTIWISFRYPTFIWTSVLNILTLLCGMTTNGVCFVLLDS
jgi:hypothetical protein